MKLPRVFAALLLGAVATLGVAAEEPRATDDQLLKKISLDLVDAEPGQVFGSFGQLAGWRIDLDAGVTRKLSIRLQAVTLRTALTAVCESVDCTWELEGGATPTLKIRPLSGAPPRSQSAPAREGALDEPIEMELDQAPAAAVFSSFGALLGAEVSLAPVLESRKISIAAHRTPVREVLDSVCRQIGCAWELALSPRTLRISAKP